MRRLAATGKYTRRDLAGLFDTTPANVGFILNNKTWVEDQPGLTTPVVK